MIVMKDKSFVRIGTNQSLLRRTGVKEGQPGNIIIQQYYLINIMSSLQKSTSLSFPIHCDKGSSEQNYEIIWNPPNSPNCHDITWQ